MFRSRWAAPFSAAIILTAALSGTASANDTTASMGAGGLVLERTDGIVMRSEDLYVSAREIRVKYRFFNRTAADISTIVAFPMPDIPGGSESDLGVSFEDPTEPTPFTTTVDGVAAPTHVEQKALLGGVDFTAELTANGVPVHPYLDQTRAALTALSPEVLARLEAQGLVEDRGYTGDDGVAHPDITPLWTLKTTHYWTQVFPAGREIGIDHRYTPAAGGTVDTLIGRTDLEGDAEAQAYWQGEQARYAAQYCTDPDFIAAARRKRVPDQVLPETWIDYVLVTGANWAEPIGDFRLVVDKGSPSALVSFCATGVRKISPTQFEVRHRDFVPTRDLSVLILHGDSEP
ncbi:DUF4424 domain-containing protein [Brevundimonas sp.]|uniref:DUF4424 domain-containing protein n=1 Tax=Brevundimonas sp. TaxID=1871086 RepID=UPI003BA96CF8